jgi:nucleotide-binding universal stress UspA family protein
VTAFKTKSEGTIPRSEAEGTFSRGLGTMRNIKRILLPVDFPLASLDVVHQAAMLARHFNSEIVMLHVATARSHAAGVPEAGSDLARWDLLAEVIKQERKRNDPSFGPELDGLNIRSKLTNGDVAVEIVQTAQDEKADLIMMPSHSFTFYQFLMGSVTAKVLHGTECPVWTGAHVPGSPGQKFSIRNVLGAVEFGPRCDIAASWAAHLAAEFGAHLTLANVTPGVDLWGPGGNYVDKRWKEELVRNASQQMAKLQKEMDLKADVFIGSGDVPTVLSQVAKQTKADLLVTGCYPYGGHLRTHGYGIICAVPIPVLSV